MSRNALFNTICFIFGFLLLVFLPSCGGSGDDDANGSSGGKTAVATTSDKNHCTLSVQGDADAAIDSIVYDIDQSESVGVQQVYASYGTSSGGLTTGTFSCNHVETVVGVSPDMVTPKEISAAVTITVAKDFRDLVPFTVTPTSLPPGMIDVKYDEQDDASRAWNCVGVHYRTTDGFPVDLDRVAGDYTFTMDSIAVQGTVPSQGLTIFTVHGSGHFECPITTSASSRGGKGTATLDITF